VVELARREGRGGGREGERRRDALVVRDVALVARGEGHVAATVGRVLDQVLERGQHDVLHVAAVLLAHATREREGLEVAAGAHTHRGLTKAKLGQVELAVSGEASNALEGPVVGVLGARRDLCTQNMTSHVVRDADRRPALTSSLSTAAVCD
jgi:hypothetical protein